MGDVTTQATTIAQNDHAPGWRGLVAAITAIQAVLALMTRTLPIFALPITVAAGVPQIAAGQMAAATSLGSMLFFLWGPALLSRYPAIRQLQAGAMLSALAILFCISGNWLLILLAAFTIGIGYGPSAPAGSDILMQAVPERRRGLAFSIKQAGVPLGGLIAALLLPAIAAAFGITAALVLAALIALAGALGLALWRSGVETTAPCPGRAGTSLASLIMAPVTMIAMISGSERIRTLVLVSLGLGVAQGVLLAYFPVFLGEEAGYSLAGAAAAFAVLQVGGIVGRVAVGWIADRAGSGVAVLVCLCLASGLAMLAIAGVDAATPHLLVLVISAFAGLTVVSWNGVLLSELARIAPAGRVSELTSAATFLLFAVFVVSPLMAQWMFGQFGFGQGLLAAAAVPSAAGLMLALKAVRANR